MLWNRRTRREVAQMKQAKVALETAEIERHLTADHPFTFEILPQTASTNTVARQRAEEGAAEGLTVIAEEQTAGRGRFTRRFYSPTGTGLYMSVVLRPTAEPTDIPLITVAAAAAVAESIEALTDRKTQIKWVNDVLLDGKKVCGILTESALNPETGKAAYAVLGIGVNVTAPEGGFADEIRDSAGAVFEEPVPFGRERLAAAILQRFWCYYTALSERRFLAPYRARSLVLGREVMVHRAEGDAYPATVLELDDDACLWVRCPDGTQQRLGSGEVSLRLK